MESETTKVNAVATFLQNKPDQPVIIMDTPGLGDSEGRDTKHLANMVVDLKNVRFVNSFVITWNSEENRFSEQLKDTIEIFKQMFGEDFFKNVIICFTKFYTDKESMKRRKIGKPQLITQMQQQFKAKF